MIAKLLTIAVAIAIAFVAYSEATVSVTTYSDSGCTTAVGFYASNEACVLISKRATEGLTCTAASADGPWYSVGQCSVGSGDPTATVPDGMQSFKYGAFSPCDFSSNYEIIASGTSQTIPIIVYIVATYSFAPFNTTISCDSITGTMSIEACPPSLGCASFDAVPNNVCTNITTRIQDQFSNGIQTSCVAVPQAAPIAPMAAPMSAPMAAPMAAPVAAPKAATPARKSAAVPVAVGSVVALASAATLLL